MGHVLWSARGGRAHPRPRRRRGQRALVQYGEQDPIITPARAGALTAALRGGGWDVASRGYPMAHSQRIEMMADAHDWLARLP